jgi:hypothetical protein
MYIFVAVSNVLNTNVMSKKKLLNNYNIVVVAPNIGGGDTTTTTSNQIFKKQKIPCWIDFPQGFLFIKNEPC